MAEPGARAERSFAAGIKQYEKSKKQGGGIMNFNSNLQPVGIASRAALGITVAVFLSLWGAGAEAPSKRRRSWI